MNSQFTAEEIRKGISDGTIQLFPKTNGFSDVVEAVSINLESYKNLQRRVYFESSFLSFDFSQVTYWVQGQGYFGSHGSRVNKSDPVSSLVEGAPIGLVSKENSLVKTRDWTMIQQWH